MTAPRSVAIVTGGNAGIGLATATRFAQLGYDLTICGRDTTTLNAAQNALRTLGAQCLALQLDLAEAEAARELIQATHACYQRIDVLVNNAARAVTAPVDEISTTDFRGTMALNVDAIFHTTQTLWPILRAQGGGVIVNLSSLASVDPFRGFAVYGASKAWVNVFTRSCAEEGRVHNIRVFGVAPGAVETRMLRAALPDFPAGKCLSPDDVAGVICGLCAPAMTPLTGQTVFVKK